MIYRLIAQPTEKGPNSILNNQKNDIKAPPDKI